MSTDTDGRAAAITALTATLTSGLDEDEAAAKAAAGEVWEYRDSWVWAESFEVADVFGIPDTDETGIHIARHDPARVLREVTAKRAIVTRYAAVRRAFGDREGGLWPDVTRREKSHAYATLCDLAGIWSDHPDYQDEWAS